jgi:NMD protein affecting ribosome stability and mRNA decay
MKRFCPVCGKDVVRGTLCKTCARPEFTYAPIEPKYCIRCNRLLFKNKWNAPKTLAEGLAKIAQECIRAKVKILDISTPAIPGPGAALPFEIPVYHEGSEFAIPALLHTTICERCSKQGTKYYEAIIQIRPARPDAVAFLERELKKQEAKGIYINKQEQVGEGVDFFITNQTYAKVLARKITDQFGGSFRNYEKLFSRSSETSKDIFRLAVLVELPSYSVTDMIVYDLRHYQVSSVKKTLSVIDLRTGSKTSLPFEASYKKKYVALPSVIAQVTMVHPHVAVLDPQTFESTRLENAQLILDRREKPFSIGEKIRVAFDGASRAWGFL